jgi:probable HAF family extracellular repeat protein
MNWDVRFAVCCLIVLSTSYCAKSSASQFIPIAGPAEGWLLSDAKSISGDGASVIGTATMQPGHQDGFRWTASSGLEILQAIPADPDLYVTTTHASYTGEFVVGSYAHDDRAVNYESFRWNAVDGFVGLGYLQTAPERFSLAADVSADGQVIAGFSSGGNGYTEAYRWTQAAGMVGLGSLTGNNFYSLASAVSADGNVIVGESSSENGLVGFRWEEGSGMRSLGTLTSPAIGYRATAVSGNGKTIAGIIFNFESAVGSTSELFRWTAEEGIQRFEGLPGASDYGSAWAVSFDGRVILGDQWHSINLPDRLQHTALVWDAAHGMRDLQQVLIDEYELGPQLTGWNLSIPSDISDDGLSIVGGGYNPEGNRQAWIVRLDHPLSIPEPSALLLGLIAALAARRASSSARSLSGSR